jgi:hypothetical protein
VLLMLCQARIAPISNSDATTTKGQWIVSSWSRSVLWFVLLVLCLWFCVLVVCCSRYMMLFLGFASSRVWERDDAWRGARAVSTYCTYVDYSDSRRTTDSLTHSIQVGQSNYRSLRTGTYTQNRLHLQYRPVRTYV